MKKVVLALVGLSVASIVSIASAQEFYPYVSNLTGEYVNFIAFNKDGSFNNFVLVDPYEQNIELPVYFEDTDKADYSVKACLKTGQCAKISEEYFRACEHNPTKIWVTADSDSSSAKGKATLADFAIGCQNW